MRKCGECTACCYIGAVPELKKPPHRTCKYLNSNCSIYNKMNRPHVCSNFQCKWLQGLGQEEDRPDKSKVMLTLNKMNGGIWIFAIELAKDASTNSGKEIILKAVSEIDLPAIIVNYDSLPPNDLGDKVVIKKNLLPRSNKIRGDHIESLSKDIDLYELVIS